MDKQNFDYSSNLHSKVSGPLRESELLNGNPHPLKNTENAEYELVQAKESFFQSQERRLPLSKISSDNSGNQERVTNGIRNNDLNEVPEEISMDYIPYDGYDDNYQNYQDEEPQPKQSAPIPQPMVTNYREARDQKKWQKVNSGFAMF